MYQHVLRAANPEFLDCASAVGRDRVVGIDFDRYTDTHVCMCTHTHQSNLIIPVCSEDMVTPSYYVKSRIAISIT